MALVANCDSDLRVYEPTLSYNFPSREVEYAARSSLLHTIRTSYRKALCRLDGGSSSRLRRRVLARLADGGAICLGLLDPVSNILANALTTYASTGAHQPRRRDEEEGALVMLMEIMAKRSLDALLAFLTRFFPFLVESQALLYLHLARADLLLAARIALSDLGMKRFGSSHPAAVDDALRTALRCAALAAAHPDPDRLVGAWLTVSCSLHRAIKLLRKLRRRSSLSAERKLTRLLRRPTPELRDGGGEDDNDSVWRRAASRLPCPTSVPFNHTTFLKRALQDAIHGFYLQALARLPAGELRSRFHRSLLKAGHCYGPLDPVSNIILNTIWYDAAFPPTVKLDMDLICTLSLHQMENRSLYGLASFLSTRYHRIRFHEAMRCLLRADANLLIADPNLDPQGSLSVLGLQELQATLQAFRAAGFCDAMDGVYTLAQGRPDTSVEKGFLAAAIAGHHPNPDAQAKFLSSCKPALGSFLLLLQSGEQLSSQDVQLLASKLLSPQSSCEKPLLPFLIASPFVMELVRKHARILNKVASVLHQMPDGDNYELLVVCGVNDEVSGPIHSLDSDSFAPYSCRRSHVNFFATHKIAKGVPQLFFAELSNGDRDEAELQPFCCLVSTPKPCAERVRCLYCDYSGIKIVHPQQDFHGREWEFEQMACGKDPNNDKFDPEIMVPYYTNLNIIDNSSLVADIVYTRLKEDDFYEDSYGKKSAVDDDLDCEGDLDLMSDDDLPAWAYDLVSSSIC
ncbi:hypothetical protein ACP4OV_002988 [Aristida adscensionis]